MVSLSMFALPSGVVALYGSGSMLGLQTMAPGIGAGVILHLQGLAAVDVAIQTSATLLATISPALAVTVLSARLVRALDRERDLSLHDPLTGVLNRRGLETEMPALLSAALASRLSVGVVLLDIDHFKQLNDQHGHSAGDLVLQQVSDRLRAGVRAKDAICRLGGEEFAVLCVTEPEDLPALAERLRHDISASSHHQVTVSIGATCLDPETAAAPGGTDRIWAVIGEADRLMYQAKRAGRDQVCAAASVPETEPASAAEPVADPEPILARPARTLG
jgi:diguanylate cyclase (GGDEF)-like protein